MPLPDIDVSRVAQHPGFLGTLGGVISLRWCPGLTRVDKLLNVASAAALSYYGGPVVKELLHLTEAQTSLGGLVLGVFGISIADALVQGIKSINLAEIADTWLKRR